MATSYMEMIYIDSDENARQTGVRAAMSTNAETWAAFNSYRHLEVSQGSARFVLDYYNAKGDISDTIMLSAADFEKIGGEKVKTDAEYRAIDDEYWRVAREEYAATRKVAA